MDKKRDNNIKRSSSMFLSGSIRNPYEDRAHAASNAVV